MTKASMIATVLMYGFLVSCGGGDDDNPAPSSSGTAVPAAGSAPTPTSTIRTTTVPAPLAPLADFAATVTVAPSDGAVISGIVRIEVVGTGLGLVALAPPNSVIPAEFELFQISQDRRTAFLDLDTRRKPNGPLTVRITAFDLSSDLANARQIPAMGTRTWQVQNAVPAVGTLTPTIPAAGISTSNIPVAGALIPTVPAVGTFTQTVPATGLPRSSGTCIFPDDRAADGSLCGNRASTIRPSGQ